MNEKLTQLVLAALPTAIFVATVAGYRVPSSPHRFPSRLEARFGGALLASPAAAALSQQGVCVDVKLLAAISQRPESLVNS